MSVLRETGKWLLRLGLLVFLALLVVFLTALYQYEQKSRKDAMALSSARALLTDMWNEIDERWAERVRIPKPELDDLIKSKWGNEKFVNLTTFDAVILSDPLIIYHGDEVRRHVQILFRDGGIVPWDRQTWRSVYLKPNAGELGDKTQQTEP
jgi:hypothetical protein